MMYTSSRLNELFSKDGLGLSKDSPLVLDLDLNNFTLVSFESIVYNLAVTCLIICDFHVEKSPATICFLASPVNQT